MASAEILVSGGVAADVMTLTVASGESLYGSAPLDYGIITSGSSASRTGDWSGATMRGEVRASPDGPALDPAMPFDCVNEGYANGETVFNVYLFEGTGSQGTGSLPPDGDADGVEEFPFDLLITPLGGVEELLIGGVLPVVGRIIE